MASGARAVVVVRAARAADAAARLRLLRDAAADSHTDAFFYFFFQEAVLQGVVLCGAVLFIFCGVPAASCALLVPAAAIVVMLAVRAHSASTCAAYDAKLRNEAAGWVAELRGPLLVSPATSTPVVLEHELREDTSTEPHHREVIGTVSVSVHRGVRHAGWVWGLAVSRGRRRRGAGAALLAAAAAGAGAAGGRSASLHAVTSQLQPDARALMHKHGWECRGTYHRQLLGDAVTLPMAHLVIDLPYA